MMLTLIKIFLSSAHLHNNKVDLTNHFERGLKLPNVCKVAKTPLAKLRCRTKSLSFESALVRITEA